MSNNKAPKAAVYVQPDLKDGDWSVDELRARNAAQFETANEANRGTWSKSPTLTSSEIKTLDGTFRVPKKDAFNAIGQPVDLVSKNPAGYKSAESTLLAEGASRPVND
jgi:hypothetical protein